MVLSYSPEGTFVLTLFGLVLSGLSLTVLLWIRSREPSVRTSPSVRALATGFALLSGAFAARALYCALGTSPPGETHDEYFWLFFASEEARLLAAAALVTGYLIQRGRHAAARVVIGIALVLAVGAALRAPADAALSARSIVPLAAPRVAEVGVLLAGVALVRRSRGLSLTAALVLLAAGRAVPLLAVARPAMTELSWSIEHMATLAGLIVLALALERESQLTALRFFLRLNLTFLVLASSLIMVVTESERRQLVDLSALQIQDLAEFVRGHTLYYAGRGEPPEQVLGHKDVVRKLVAEFGRYPDLRRIQVRLQGRAMALSINEQGEIDQQFWTGVRVIPPRVSPSDFAVASLLHVPILSAGRPVGSVDLDHSLERINQQIGWRMQVIFGVFTLFVIVASIVTGMLVLAADRTIRSQYDELERTQRRLSVAERLASIGAVADGVAHEINNPAGILVTRTDYLLSVIQSSRAYAEIREDLETIRRQAQRIARTVKDLLTFTRQAPMLRELCDLRAVVESAVALVRPLALERAVTLETSVAPGAPRVCGDPDRLEQVFVNLLTNAVQAISEGGLVAVSVSRQPVGHGVEVIVRDTGSGIRPEHLDRIFDPFFTTKEPGAGTGLGLSIAYGIIRNHDGAIDVSSTLGAGTEFRVILPPAGTCADEAAIEPSPAAEPQPGGAAATAPDATPRANA